MSKKDCQARWYANHKDEHIKKVTARKLQQVVRSQKLIIDYLLSHPCVDCGETDIVVLQFDHVRGVKRKDLSRLLSFSERTVQNEIAKCDVRCANCHQRKTAERKRSYRFLWVAGVSGNIHPS